MAHKIDPREVLEYLNELGYTNISAQQLKDFIIDLKKLIKYDSRYRNEDINISSYIPKESGYCECSDSKEESSLSKSECNKETERGLSIPSEKINYPIKNEVQKDKHIALHIYNSKKNKNVSHEHCKHISENNATPNTGRLNFVINKVTDSNSVNNDSGSTVLSIQPFSSRDLRSQSNKTSSKDKKSKVSFIRPVSAKPLFNKCDPVALYHHYQSEWKKTKIPGQDKREELRWAIREKMMVGPRIQLKSRPFVRSCSSCR